MVQNRVRIQPNEMNINIKLAQAYIPYQEYKNLYPVEEALYKGTIFADLYRPYEAYKK